MDMFEENLKVLEEAMEQMCIDFTTDSSESESSSNEEEEEKEEETQPPSEARQAQLLLQYQATMKLLANSQPLRRSSCGKRLRLDVPASIKRLAVRLLSDNVPFGLISQTIFLKTDGRVVLRQRRQLEEWRQAAESLDNRKSFRQHGAGRKPTKPELDAELLAWLTCRRARHELVSVSSLRLEAARINGAEVSRSWLTRWRRRHHVVLRAVQRMMISPERITSCAQKFHEHVLRLSLGCEVVINFDEIPLSFCGLMSCKRTLDFEGTQDVIVAEDPAHYKRKASFIACIACKRSGEPVQVPAAVLLKESCAKLPVPVHAHMSTLIRHNRSGVIDTTFFVQHFIPFLRGALSSFVPAQVLVVFDSARGHISAVSLRALHAVGWKICVIPGGMTQFLQAVDVWYASQFRRRYHELYRANGSASTVRLSVSAIRHGIVTWSEQAHRELSCSCTLHSTFRALGYFDPRDCVSLRTHIYTFKVPQEVNEVTEEKMEPTQTKEGQRKITDYFASR